MNSGFIRSWLALLLPSIMTRLKIVRFFCFTSGKICQRSYYASQIDLYVLVRISTLLYHIQFHGYLIICSSESRSTYLPLFTVYCSFKFIYHIISLKYSRTFHLLSELAYRLVLE
ncbi:uncharacterized protein K460DRAFT_181836 [Cucurbitaria berberidis CBS 394.84]|uniref:Uncharacterized protein n=1 Tax=Cucurbitaria berberidis CBS 394.84 TaxID=1168544 RepID=A0A9P4GBN0_9PLEO|nr:uncharacterized protein K460DRAFT_181836 [Cucurbitaria berberidis CBS 394.84]KAF1842289.1 hypothetical protein K460DRAFT_181836 [Cucurbitaria berberidis CBS 394.84]